MQIASNHSEGYLYGYLLIGSICNKNRTKHSKNADTEQRNHQHHKPNITTLKTIGG